jgi:hypothetical protein
MDLSEELRACIARGRCAAEPDAPSERRAVRIRSIEKVHPQLQTGLQGVTDGWFGVVSSAQKVLLWSTGPAAPRSAPEPHLSDLSDIEAFDLLHDPLELSPAPPTRRDRQALQDELNAASREGAAFALCLEGQPERWAGGAGGYNIVQR